MIRIATPEDAQPILDIYAPYILNTSLTFETEVPSQPDFASRIESYLNNWPWLVCELDGRIAGYAYASRYRERTAYQWSVECSVYIHDDYMGSGIASQLYTTLFAFLKYQGYNNVYAVINLPNDRSVAFHEKMGFTYFATYENVGYKLGRWKNVGWWQKKLNEYVNEPQAPLKFSTVSNEIKANILKKIKDKN